ncbi:MAG TPA: MHYT domain-containing protein [Rhizomicrobium sp.]|jgi:signal transduction histidine kinase
MLHVLGCITEQHDLRLVVLAALLCFFACTTAMSMIARGRAAQGRMRTMWLAAGGLVAGCGIWGLHFVAMLAYRSGLPVAYDVWLTALSVVIAASISALGFTLAFSRMGPAFGGAVTGAAISAMHYTGMAAVRIPAVASWDVGYVVASLLIGILLSALALHIALRRDDIRGYAIGAGLFAVAIVGMHFTAMSAVVFLPDPTVTVTGVVIDPGILAIAIAATVVLIMALGLIGALVDHHLAARASEEATRLHAHIAELEATQKQLESTSEHLSAALDAADAANRAKSQFLATMSHELRTPLNAVIGFAEIISSEIFGPLGSARYREYAGDIRASGAHLLSLINDILDLSRLDAGQAGLNEEMLDVSALVAETSRMMRRQAEEADLEIAEKVDPGLPALRADKRRVRQVLLNLLSNAIKFTPGKGRIVVSAARRGSELAVIVTDTGIGIAKDDIATALEHFGQIDGRLSRRYEGAGLGLPLAKQLMELHGGRLELASEPSRGTTVAMVFPTERLFDPVRAVA